MVVLRNGIEPLLASRGGDRLAFPNQSETQHIKPGEGKEWQAFTGERRNMLVDTRAGENDKTPRASYSFKGSCKTSCVHYKPCQVVKSNK